MSLFSLIDKNHYLFLIGTSDNEYNLFFLNQIAETINSPTELISISIGDFINSSAIPHSFLLIKEVDRYLEQCNVEQVHTFIKKCRSLKNTGTLKVIFFLNLNNLHFSEGHPQIKSLFNESLYFIPNPDALTQLSFFSYPLSKDLRHHLLGVFEQKTTPIFIISLASRIIDNFYGRDFSSRDFQIIGGFEGLINIAGEKLEEALSAAGIQLELVNFFRPFINIDSTNYGSLVGQTKNSIIEISKSSPSEVEIFLNEAIKSEFVRESQPGIFELASKSLATYWEPFTKWVLLEVTLVNQYRGLQKMALQYHNNKGQLLSAAQIDEVNSWKSSFPFSTAWGEQYAPETEIIWNFIDYSILVNEANKEAETRKNRRLIRMTRAVAAVIGIAFILSFVAAIYAGIERKKAILSQNVAEKERIRALQSKEEADLQRIKAEEASQSESLAKIAAEKDRQAALLASEIAIQEKQNALLAKNNAEKEKEKAESARKDAEQAKVVAEQAREEALLAQAAEKEALAISVKNFENAEKLRLQQMASTMGLTASQLIREMKFSESLEKAVEAFELNTNNFGSVYEPVIAKALIEANTKFNALEYNFQKPIKKIQVSKDGNQVACLFIDDELIDYNLKNQETRIVASNASSLILDDNNSLWITTKDNRILTYSFTNGMIEEKNYLHTGSKLIGVVPLSGFLEDLLIIKENGMFNSSGNEVIPILNEESSPSDYKINSEHQLFFLKESAAISVFSLSDHNFFDKIDAISLPSEMEIRSFDFISTSNNIIIGDVTGNIYSYDLGQKSLQSLGNVHDSRISFLKAITLLNTPLIISASFDHTWKLTPIDITNNQLGQPITFQAHSGWITSAVYHEPTNQLVTAGNDKNLFYWQINLEEIVKNFNKI